MRGVYVNISHEQGIRILDANEDDLAELTHLEQVVQSNRDFHWRKRREKKGGAAASPQNHLNLSLYTIWVSTRYVNRGLYTICVYHVLALFITFKFCDHKCPG